MTTVNFYILTSQSEPERERFACKLAEKAFREQKNLYILTESGAQNRKLDDMLWTFRAGSFIPHQIYTEEQPHPENKIVIGTHPAPVDWENTIINLSSHCPENIDNTQLILEILDGGEETKRSGRSRYRHYQQLKLAINTYKM